MVDHVHFHMIPKPNEKEGLGVGWPMKEGVSKEELGETAERMRSMM